MSERVWVVEVKSQLTGHWLAHECSTSEEEASVLRDRYRLRESRVVPYIREKKESPDEAA